MSSIFLFANPTAGRGRSGTIARKLTAAFERRGIRVRAFQDHADSIPDSALKSDSPPLAAVAIGGDGTIRGVVERLLRFAGGDAARVPPVVVVPLGTANLMAQHLKLNWSDDGIADEVVAATINGKVARLDTAIANGRLFLLMAGVGIDAAVVHELDRIRAGPISRASYAIPSFLALQQYSFPPLKVSIDGKRLLNNEPALAFVGNVAEYGTGFPILLRARSADGLLDLCVLPCRSWMDLMDLLLAVADGNHLHKEGVIYQTGRVIRIDSTQSAPVQIDGEASGHTPLDVELLPSKVAFIVR